MKNLIIEKDKLLKNIDIIKNSTKSEIIAVLKADAYGLGLLKFADILLQNDISFFAVTDVCDALRLKSMSDVPKEVLMLTATEIKDELSDLIEEEVQLTVSSVKQAEMINELALDKPAKVHIKIDTGMSRFGFLPSEIDDIKYIYENLKNIKIVGVYSHFHSAISQKDVKNQKKTFDDVLEKLKDINFQYIHLANSYATLNHPETHYNTVRIGSLFVGRIAGSHKLSKIGYIKTEVISVRNIKKGATVGYSKGFKAKKDTQIAIIPVGYFDGFNVKKQDDLFRVVDTLRYMFGNLKDLIKKRAVYVEINGKKAKVLGHIGLTNVIVDTSSIQASVSNEVKMDVSMLHINPLVEKKYV